MTRPSWSEVCQGYVVCPSPTSRERFGYNRGVRPTCADACKNYRDIYAQVWVERYYATARPGSLLNYIGIVTVYLIELELDLLLWTRIACRRCVLPVDCILRL